MTVALPFAMLMVAVKPWVSSQRFWMPSLLLFYIKNGGIALKKLSRIYIELTNVCNLSCSFCVGNSRPQRFMNTVEFEAIAHQVKAHTDYIYLHVLGEPLLHPQLADCLAIAHQAALRVNITTNGTLLATRQPLLLSAPALRKVSISLHSLEGGDMDSYLDDVVAFALAAGQIGVLCELRAWNLATPHTHNAALFHQLCHRFSLDTATRQAACTALESGGTATLAPHIFLGAAPRFAWPSLDAPVTSQPIFCHGLRSHAAILCDGTVVPCCLDSRGDIPLGNALQTPLTDILTSPYAQAIYNGFSRRTPTAPLCRHCTYATRF